MDTVAVQCDKQATIVGLSLSTLGDGRRGQVLSTVGRRPSLFDYSFVCDWA